MSDAIRDIDAQRARWRRWRAAQSLVDSSAEDFARGGLGGRVAQLDVRMLFLPHDPEADLVPLNPDTVAWLRQLRPSPWDGQPIPVGSREGASNNVIAIHVIAIHESWRDDGAWEHYLAIHRHGGVELATRCAYQVHETRVFALRQLVGYAWTLAALQVDSIEKWDLPQPYEFSVALLDTKGSLLGGFAEGWEEPLQGFRDVKGAADEHVLIRQEFTELPESDPFAIDLGGRIENAFGTTYRRHLANRGDYKGLFDPRFGF